MTAPSQRRRDPQPIGRTGELAAAAVGAALIAVALAALAGLGIASALFGGGWVWPHGTNTIAHALGGLLHGHPGRGLPPQLLHRIPGPAPVYACVAASELALLTAAAGIGVLIARYHRPGGTRGGMATRREAEQALGLSQLRAAAPIIRPDLCGRPVDRRQRPALRQPGLSTAWAWISGSIHRSTRTGQHAGAADNSEGQPSLSPPLDPGTGASR